MWARPAGEIDRRSPRVYKKQEGDGKRASSSFSIPFLLLAFLQLAKQLTAIAGSANDRRDDAMFR
jgi:hypothetical protein